MWELVIWKKKSDSFFKRPNLWWAKTHSVQVKWFISFSSKLLFKEIDGQLVIYKVKVIFSETHWTVKQWMHWTAETRMNENWSVRFTTAACLALRKRKYFHVWLWMWRTCFNLDSGSLSKMDFLSCVQIPM